MASADHPGRGTAVKSAESRPSEPPPSRSMLPEVFADYIAEMGGMLVEYGCPSYRLEEVIRVVSEIEGYEAAALGLPTGVVISLRSPQMRTPIIRMVRVKQWGVDLERLVVVDHIFNQVAERKITIAAATASLHQLSSRPRPYSRASQALSVAAVSATAAVFFRGGIYEVIASFVAGAIVSILGMMTSRNPQARFLVDFLGGISSAAAAVALTQWRPDLSREVVVLSGVITLVPGMTLTTGLAELARKQLVSGVSRMAEALVVLLLIVFGIALVVGLKQIEPEQLGQVAAREGLGIVPQVGAMLIAAICFAVLFSTPKKFIWTAVLSASLGWVTTSVGVRYLPPHMAGFVAALVVSMFANGFARITQRPAQLFMLPGIALLVPGSFGFLSLESFLRADFVNGAAKGFEMIMTAGALVTGILVANVLMPPRKLL